MFNLSQPLRSRIATPIGNRKNSDPLDVINTRNNFASLGRLTDNTELGVIDRKLDNTIRDFQRDKGLKEDGLMNPGGETERTLNRELSSKNNPESRRNFFDTPLNLSAPVGNNRENTSEDVKQIQRKLGTLGLASDAKATEPSGIIDRETVDAILLFQKQNNLRADGFLKPGGETEARLNAAPLNEDEKDEGQDDGKDQEKEEKKPEKDDGDKEKENPDDEEKKCEQEEIDWVNAEAELAITQQNLERVEEEKNSLEAQLSQKQTELAEIQEKINKEKEDKKTARNIGGKTGATGGAIIGAPAGPGSSMGLAGIGIGVGAFLGDIIEEIGDAVSPDHETNVSLNFKKQRLIKKIKELQTKIKKLHNKITTVLQPTVNIAQEKANKTKNAFFQCKNNN